MEVSGRLHAPAALLPGKLPLVPTRCWVGPRAVVVKRKIPGPMPGLEPQIIQHVGQRYTTELSGLQLD
jgi:hypothetical protein